ncbi:hypothetical protein J2Z17_004190 [Rhizobium halophytocola]|uniref:Uncharacterized protein n=1 Tax=Rhizobium halophytocola TaxID=735519 RepID=A0ABS4E461_9HYPH|nr:hypothetical protein [Rhizobium halophytocola]
MTKNVISSHHFQRKISEFCELRIALIACRRVLEEYPALPGQFDHLPKITTAPEWPYRLDDD